MKNPWLTIGAAWTGLAVALGAFGAHGLEKVTDSAKAHAWWKTASDYQFGQGLGLILVGMALHAGLLSKPWAGRLVWVGSWIFSGSLYAMALGAPRWFGAITPIGGTALIAGWIWFALEVHRPKGLPPRGPQQR